MYLKKKIYLLIIIIFQFLLGASEIRIISKVNNEIITNIDVENKINFLKVQNTNVNKLRLQELKEVSKNSLVRQIIKKKETDKFFDFEKNLNIGEKLIKQSYLEKGFNNKSEFISFLKRNKLEYEDYKEKIVIEKLWNTLIIENSKNKIKIDENDIRKKVKNFFLKQEKIYEYKLSEILYDSKTLTSEILNFIDTYSFETAASKYSISDTSANGGEIGWVKINNLSDKLKDVISSLSTGEISKPIQISNGNLLIKINKIREVKRKFDLDEEVKKQITFERNRQLNNYSLNFYKKLKQNSIINEY